MERVAVIDFETTGLSPEHGGRATEIAAVLLEEGRVVARYQSLMNAGVRMPAFIAELTGITDAMLRQAPPAAEVMREIQRVQKDQLAKCLERHRAGALVQQKATGAEAFIEPLDAEAMAPRPNR